MSVKSEGPVPMGNLDSSTDDLEIPEADLVTSEGDLVTSECDQDTLECDLVTSEWDLDTPGGDLVTDDVGGEDGWSGNALSAESALLASASTSVPRCRSGQICKGNVR